MIWMDWLQKKMLRIPLTKLFPSQRWHKWKKFGKIYVQNRRIYFQMTKMLMWMCTWLMVSLPKILRDLPQTTAVWIWKTKRKSRKSRRWNVVFQIHCLFITVSLIYQPFWVCMRQIVKNSKWLWWILEKVPKTRMNSNFMKWVSCRGLMYLIHCRMESTTIDRNLAKIWRLCTWNSSNIWAMRLRAHSFLILEHQNADRE